VDRIDFSDADGSAKLSAQPLNVELNARVERAAAAAAKLPRVYLGASIVGHECMRQVQYEWWCVPMLPARVQAIFDRGHFFEARMRAQLIQAGFLVAPKEALEFVALDGLLQGHADGIITSGPPMPGVYLPFPCIWECKALNAKNWRAVDRDGFAKVFPRYAIQVALYQFHLDKLNPALVTCCNADTCEVLHLPLPFSAERAREAINRAKEIIAVTRAGQLLPRFTSDPTDWRCNICAHRERCWGTSA
jgi:hypothetical protein